MTKDLRTLIAEWEGQAVLTGFDQPTGTWFFVAIHDATLGTPCGGCRMRVYPTPEDGLRDAMRLARGMTHKWAAIDFDHGGGKSVLAIPRPIAGEERSALLHRFGQFLNTLNGSYTTGVDLGTTADDMETIKEVSPWVFTGHPALGGRVDPSPHTALGVFACIQAAARRVFGSDGVTGRTVLIQGAGGVGGPLAHLLADAGANILVSDMDPDRARECAEQVRGTVVDPAAVSDTPCDILAPCAVGATLNRDSIPRLRCRIVAGAANNQLEEDADAERLAARGILYCPDYVVNGGGALLVGLIQRDVTDEVELRRRLLGIGESLDRILAEAEERGTTPLRASYDRVERVLANHRDRRPAPR